MRRSPRQQAIYAVAILSAAAPFIFGLIRAVAAGDLRMLWMALAASLGAAAVRMAGKKRTQTPNAGLLSVATLLIATLLAGSTAYLLGATAAFGIWAVAVVLGLCLAASCALDALSRPRGSQAATAPDATTVR
jgi:hypothetical protein